METKELVEKNKHIPSSEILQDIKDTEAEIVTMEREAKGYEMIGDKMAMFKATARRNGIKERQQFISDLNRLLKAREE